MGVAVDTKEIPSFPGFFVSKCGRVFGPHNNNPLYERKWKLSKCPKGRKQKNVPYFLVAINKKWRRIHRLLCETYVGPIPFDGAVVDHIDGNTLNNNIDNLRWCTQRMNLLNRHDNVKGYYVRIHKNGKTVYYTHPYIKYNIKGKTFDTPEEAHKYYLEGLEIRRADAQKEFEELIQNLGQYK